MHPSPTDHRRQIRAWAGAVALFAAACAPPPSAIEHAALLSQKGQDGAAIRVLEAHVKQHPADIAERRLLVRLFAATGDLASARREAAEIAARSPPTSPLPWLELGHALEIAHRYDEALSMYDRAAEVAPKDPAGPRTGGLRAARWGEAELSAPRLEEALRRDPRAAEVWHALGLVRFHLGDLAGAALAYESGLVANPRALENRIGLATLALRRRDPERALHEYDRVLRERPGFADGYLGRAWAQIALSRFDDAAASLEEARRRGADARAIARQEELLNALKGVEKKSKKGLNP